VSEKGMPTVIDPS